MKLIITISLPLNGLNLRKKFSNDQYHFNKTQKLTARYVLIWDENSTDWSLYCQMSCTKAGLWNIVTSCVKEPLHALVSFFSIIFGSWTTWKFSDLIVTLPQISTYKLNLFNKCSLISSSYRNGQFVMENSESKNHFSGCVPEHVNCCTPLLYAKMLL